MSQTIEKSDETYKRWCFEGCGKLLRKVMSMKWMREMCNDEKENQEATCAVTCQECQKG